MRRLLVLIAVLAAPALARAENIHAFTLDNGLQGVVLEDHRAPIVTHMVWYKVGAADDPPRLSGLAHFLEHLMFKATDDLDTGEFSRIVAENGGDENAFTSYDYTAYFQKIAADRLDLVMGMEADRMVDLAPGGAGVLSERDVVREERRQTVERSPSGPFNEARRAALFLHHPYGAPIIGWDHEIATFTEEAALDFYRAHYAPNNAILIVAGDVTPQEVETLARKHFGPIPASAAARARTRPQEPPQRAARRITLTDARVSEPYLTRSWLAPVRAPGDQAEAAALTVLSEILGGSGITSHLARTLELDLGVAVSTGAYYDATAMDDDSLTVYVVPQPGQTLASAEAALDAALARFIETGPEPAHLDRVKAGLRAAHIYARDSQYLRTREIGTALTSGLTIEDVRAWPDSLQAVTAEEVRAAAERLMQPERSVTAWLTGEETAQ